MEGEVADQVQDSEPSSDEDDKIIKKCFLFLIFLPLSSYSIA